MNDDDIFDTLSNFFIKKRLFTFVNYISQVFGPEEMPLGRREPYSGDQRFFLHCAQLPRFLSEFSDSDNTARRASLIKRNAKITKSLPRNVLKKLSFIFVFLFLSVIFSWRFSALNVIFLFSF